MEIMAPMEDMTSREILRRFCMIGISHAYVRSLIEFKIKQKGFLYIRVSIGVHLLCCDD